MSWGLRCNGLHGFCTFSCNGQILRLILVFSINVPEIGFVVLNWLLILVGDRATLPSLTVCFAGTEAPLEGFLGVMKGFSNSSKSIQRS